jgi:hypothetical protein
MMRLLLVSLIAFVLLLVFGFVRMFFFDLYNWKLWPAIRRARRDIRKVARQRIPNAQVYSSQGATAISAGHLSFCIRTDTDKERDLLRQDPDIHRQFRDALIRAGYPKETHPVVHFSIESQETVDRDYGGSWDEASQMP